MKKRLVCWLLCLGMLMSSTNVLANGTQTMAMDELVVEEGQKMSSLELQGEPLQGQNSISEDGKLNRENSADLKSKEIQGTEGAQKAEGNQKREGTDGNQETEGTQKTEGTEGNQETEGTEGNQETEENQRTEGTEGNQETEGNQGTQETEKNQKTEVKSDELEKTETQETENLLDEQPLDGEPEWTYQGEFPYITSVNITDKNGNPISGETFNRDGNINILFEFAIPNNVDIKAGDYYTIRIPSGFEIVDNIPPTYLDASSGIDMTWELSNNVITIKALSDLGVLSNVSGFISIGCWFSRDSQLGKDGQPIYFDINGNIFKVDVHYDEISKSTTAKVSKKGSYNKGNHEITWEVVVQPDQGTSLMGVVLKDQFDSSKQYFVANSIKVDGVEVSDKDVSFSENGFTYTLPKEIGIGTKTITFKTHVKDEYFWNLKENKVVKNHVETLMPDGDKSSEAEADVEVSGTMISKSATNWNPVSKKMGWSVKVNSEKVTLNNAKVIDTYPEGSHIDTNSIKVDGKTTSDFEVDDVTRKISINLGNISKEVTITYDLIIDDYSKFDKKGNNIYISNTAELYQEGKFVGEATAERGIGIGVTDIPFEKNGSVQSNATYGQYISWNLKINSSTWNHQIIDDAIVINDILPDNLTLIEEMGANLRVTFSDGTTKSVKLSSNQFYDSSSKKISYTISPEMVIGGRKVENDCSYTLEFFTSIVGTQSGRFKNVATITLGDKTEEAEKTVNISYNSEKMLSKKGEYNYSTSTFDWNVTINKDRKGLVNPVITERLPENHVLADGYIYVGGTEIPVDGTTVNGINAVYNESANTIVISYDKYQNTRQVISLRTKYTGEGSVTSKNCVELKADNLDQTFTAEDTVRYQKTPELEKTTTYTKGNHITWQVAINLNRENVKDLILTDELSAGLSLEVDTVNMKLAEISKDGQIIPTETTVGVGSINYEETTGVFTVSLPDGLDMTKPYILYFTTAIRDKEMVTINNTISLSGTGIQYNSTSNDVKIQVTTSSSGIQGVAGSVKILKLDKETNKPLAGAAFQLLNAKKEVVSDAGWATTNEEGIAEFKKWLKLDTEYYVQEVRAPQNYKYDDTMYKVIVSSSEEEPTIELTVYNELEKPETIDIEGEKTWDDGNDKDGLRPNEITVNLLADGEKVASVVTSEEKDWKYAFTDLPKYKDKEEIVYTISEDPVRGYETTVDGYNLKNIHVPKVVEKPEKPTPEEPEKPTPEEPEKPTPEEPERPTPSEPEKPTPSEPEKPIPNKPDEVEERKNNTSPKTGYEVNLGMYAAICAISAICLIIMFFIMMTKRNEN